MEVLEKGLTPLEALPYAKTVHCDGSQTWISA